MKPDASASADRRRELYRSQLRAGIGGWSGMIVTAIPPAVFVIVNVIAGLRAAIVAAIGSAVLLAGYRLARKQPVQQALSGLFAVVIAAVIAARTGQARGYFLLGIWASFAYAVPFAISIVVRRPLVGLLWEYLDPARPESEEADHQRERRGSVPWYRCPPLLRAYTVITLVATAVFLARGLVQWTLYGNDATGWLAFAKIAMGYPLFAAAVAFGLWYGTRARRRVGSADDAAPDRGLGLR